MRKNLIILLIILIESHSFGQGVDLRERLYLHPSRQTIICGETLHFSIYNLSDKTGKLIDLSKIVYVQLVGKEGSVSKQKVSLEKGLGESEMFISSLTSTGQYYLVAYTRWMKNFEDKLVIPITIINPFEPYEKPPMTSEDWTITYSSNNTSIIPDKENNLVISVVDNYGSRPSFSGRLMNRNNEKVADFHSTINGYADLSFTPKNNELYQIILQDDDQSFHFGKIEGVRKNNSFIHLSKANDEIIIQAKSSLEKVSLCLFTNSDTLFNKNIGSIEKFSWPSNELPNGILFFNLIDVKGNTLSSVKYYHSDRVINEYNDPVIYTKKTNVAKTLELPNGNYSVVIKKVYNHVKELKTNAITSNLDFNIQTPSFHKRPLSVSLSQVNPLENILITYLPEHQNELLAGKLLEKSSEEPIANTLLMHSLIGQSPQISATKTSANGDFLFHFESPLSNTETIIRPFLHEENYVVELEEKFIPVKIENEEPIKLDSAQIQEIVSININNQIESTFQSSSKKNSEIEMTGLNQFNPFDYEYLLDDYTRFSSLSEHFTEYVLWVKPREKGIKIFQKNSYPTPEEKPLLLLDGVPVDSKKLLGLNPYLIEKISVINNRVYLGPLVADGLLSVKTFEANLGGIDAQSFGLNRITLGISKKYVTPNYSQISNKRIPDKRSVLFWNPNVIIENNDRFIVNFYTSDIIGNFELEVEGFTADGNPISEVHLFEIK